nr:ribonuclease H-like domain-containing protein [Tanacetum cinerariifolium]GEY97742.1 ribonuclease H-like domain-containing protein [Tanacetum cinerariifolium]
KGEYDIWAMKIQNFISSSDLLCWNIVLKGNSAKSMTTDKDGNLKIRPPVTAKEHQQVQREEKARTILLSALPDEHMGNFYRMIDAKDIWNVIKARFCGNVESKKMQKSLLKQKFKEIKIFKEEGLDKGYDKMQKILSQMNTLKIKPKTKDVNMKFLRGLPPSCSGIALILKTKGGLKYISFDDIYNKLKFLEIDTKGYSSSPSTLSNAAFVNQQLIYKDLNQINKEEFKEYDLKHQMAMLSINVHRFENKHGWKIKFNGRENERFDKKLVKCFNCKQLGHFSRECRVQGGQNNNNYQKYKSKEAGKDGSDSKAMVVVDRSIDWDKQTEGGNTELRSLENFSMIAGIKIESDADSEGEVVSADDVIPAGVSVPAGTVASVVVSPQSETEFALMGLSTEDNSLRLEKGKDRGIVDSGWSRRMSGNKDKLEDFEDFDGGEVTFRGSTGKISGKGTIKTKNLNFDNVLYVKELQHFNLISVYQEFVKTIAMPEPQQNGVTERKNQTLIEAIRTMLVDSLLPIIFWSEAVATACYVLNRVLVTKPHHKTPYELLTGDKPSISYLKPFGCHVTILNTSDSLGKFDKKSDEGYIVGYSISSKAYIVYNLVSKKIEETMNINFLENKPFVAGTGQAWMFDIDYLTDSLNYSRVSSTNLTTGSQGATPSNAGSQEDNSNSDDDPDVLIIQSTPTLVVPIVDEATTQMMEEADRLRLAFPSLNPILGVGTASIGSSVSAGSTPPVSAGSTPQMSLPISAGRPTGSAGRPVSVGRPIGSAVRPVSAGRPPGSAARTPIPVDIHDGLKIFYYPKSDIFTSSYDEEFSGPDANNLASSVDSEFEMSSMGPLNFFLGLQVDQRPEGIFIHQEKYVADILKKFDLDNSKRTSTPFEPQKIREKNVPDEHISVHLYRSMIRCLMYLTATRPDIMFVVCAAARHQVTPKTSNLVSVKQIFNDYAGAHGDRKSTTAGCQFLGKRGIQSTWSMRLFKRGFCFLRPILLVRMVSAGGHSFLLVAVVSIHFCWSSSEVSLRDGVKGLVATIDGTAYTVTEASIRSALQLDALNAIDTLTNEEIFVGLRDTGYATEGKFTFFKNKFSPQWKFLIHT